MTVLLHVQLESNLKTEDKQVFSLDFSILDEKFILNHKDFSTKIRENGIFADVRFWP